MEYIPVLIMMGVGLLVGGAILILTHLLGPKAKHRLKDVAFECGVPAAGDARQRFSVRYYLVAILFLLFDIEAVFFIPWALVFKDYLEINTFILAEMAVFVAVLLVGYYYVLKKGALEWE